MIVPYKLIFTNRFKKHFKSLSVQEKKQLKGKINLLSVNPYHPSLRTKHIKGSESLFECSVNMDVRVIWSYAGNKAIILLDVGHHDVLKCY